MNPLQLEQILPLSAQATESVNSKPVQTGDASFADALRNAREEVQKEEDVKPAEISKADSYETEKVEEKDELSENNSKIAQKKSSEDKKDSKIAETETAVQNAALQGIQNAENQIQRVARKEIPVDEEIQFAVNAAEENENIVSDKMLAWLMTSEKAETAEVSDEDFTALIDAAVEFIPGVESEEEKLVNAQNLAINDPESFLQQVHELADVQIANDESVLNKKFSFSDYEEVQSKTKKSDSKLTVHDLRTQKPSVAAENAKIVQKAAAKKEMNLTYQQKNENTMQVTMELAGNAESNILSSNSQTAGATGSNFQQMLSNAVVENAPEFVKAGNVVLKDGNQGTINLILRPEKLGNVKISLNLNDKVISGQIAVQSKEALDAFRESIDSLKQAFTESGFETGSFDLNFASQDQSFAQGGDNPNPNAQYFAEKSYGDFVSSKEIASDSSAAAYSGNGEYGINIVA